MPERSFGRTVRYRRTKLGLSQAKLGELVGRSATTVRSWEKDKSHPSDISVLIALAAILGIDERHLFDKAGQALPAVESSPTIEQELATLNPEEAPVLGEEVVGEPDAPHIEPEVLEEELEVAVDPTPPDDFSTKPLVVPTPPPAYRAPPSPYVVTATTPRVHEPSYMEDSTQRQLYRVRYLATVVVLVALVIAFLWALTQGMGAWGEWWDQFFGSLRL